MTAQLRAFIDVAQDSDFPIQNLPYGVFSQGPEGERHCATALGEWVIDLSVLEDAGLLLSLIHI